MSYASVAATNAPPPSQQPHADTGLLNTEDAHASHIADDAAKVGVVSHDFREHPATLTSESEPVRQYAPAPPMKELPKKETVKAKAQDYKKTAKDVAHEAEEEGLYIWARIREQLLRPGVAGGLVGLVNVGLIGAAGYAAYTEPHLRRDPKFIGSAAAAAAVLLGAEGYAAERYRETPAGQEEERRARKEGAIIYRHAREAILRPGVLGGLIGVANVGIIGTVGYYAYSEWDRPTWDRRYVGAVAAGLATLWAGEGFLAEQYSEGKIELPKP